jgi:hypothetical protein
VLNLWPWRARINDRLRERPEINVVALPLTLKELQELTQFLARTEIADKQVIAIKDRIGRYAIRQGAWWDAPWSTTPVVTDIVWSGAAPRERRWIKGRIENLFWALSLVVLGGLFFVLRHCP